MRRSGDLFRWGLACLMLAPVAATGWFAGAGEYTFLWLALALVIAGGVLNALAIVRGVKGAVTGELIAELDGMVMPDGSPTAGGQTGTELGAPRQRVILIDGTVVREAGTGPAPRPGPEARAQRRVIGLSAAAALLGLIALGAWALAVEQPLAIAQGQLTLDEIYAVWSTASRVAFTIALTIWIIVALAITLVITVLALLPSVAADRILTPRRMLATACIAGSVIVVAALPPHFSIGISLPDELPFMAGGVASPLSTVFGLTGVALSATAILLTVPRWKRRSA
ncbi:MAG: hypothetical protein LDL15_06380 [Yonghaparkia sp.]|nr:hypothetical protein [Microcella sp.]